MITTRKRGRALQVERERFLRLQPLCVLCLAAGRQTLSEELDHIVALDNGGSDDDSNKQMLCKPCHKAKTERDMGYKPKERIGIDGFPISDHE